MAVFEESSGGKGAEFAEYFRKTTCNRQIVRDIFRLHVSFMREGVQENRGSSKKETWSI